MRDGGTSLNYHVLCVEEESEIYLLLGLEYC